MGSAAGGFNHDDRLGDVDALLVAKMLRENPNRSLDDTVREIGLNVNDDSLWRYRRFINVRFGNGCSAAAEAGESVLTPCGQLATWVGARDACISVSRPSASL